MQSMAKAETETRTRTCGAWPSRAADEDKAKGMQSMTKAEGLGRRRRLGRCTHTCTRKDTMVYHGEWSMCMMVQRMSLRMRTRR